jgi:hypothetical protein
MFAHTQINIRRTERSTQGNYSVPEPEPDLEKVAVYTFTDVDPVLVFRGSLRAAQEAHMRAREASRKNIGGFALSLSSTSTPDLVG